MSFKYYDELKKRLGREPTPVEIEAFTVMWSEHCGYSHTKKYIKMLPKAENAIQGNAGVLPIDDKWAVVFKIESHNHPSAVEPYNGAATGVGGIIRDILAMGARPHASLDSLHMGDVTEGIIRGISDYGNSIGVPTVGGELRISEFYKHNPLVNAMAVGIVERDKVIPSKASYPGQVIVLFGGATGRDGIHGASFASEDLEGEKATKLSIQVGDPFMEKQLIEAFLKMKEEGLIEGAQDLGAGGVLSATSELASAGGLGAVVYLDRVPLRESDMEPWEILISESQERMAVLTSPEKAERIMEIARYYLLETAVLGEIIQEPVYRAVYKDEVIMEVPISVITNPPLEDVYPYTPGEIPEFKHIPFEKVEPSNVYFQYDYMVGTDTVLPPGFGPAIMRIKGSEYGYSVVTHSRGDLGYQDAYWGTYIATLEAVRKTLAVGAEPLGITDCINYGDPDENPEGLSAMMHGLKDACEFAGVPVVSGNASLYNTTGGKPIPPTMVIGLVGKVKLAEIVKPHEGDVYVIGWDRFSPEYERILWDVIRKLHSCGCFIMAPSHMESLQGYQRTFSEYGYTLHIDKISAAPAHSKIIVVCNDNRCIENVDSKIPVVKVGVVERRKY